ncbi:hypothetical protein RIF29_23677 [Crotalaria pallida]|uniref:CCHC-type domain-containing protein n=1 Tax=Crotalaria pallida TaxID=3830 RepID=A0AAN9F6C5_CROPI
MVSERQRQARKKYRAEHPELFPKPDPTPSKDPHSHSSKKKKKKKNKNPNNNNNNKLGVTTNNNKPFKSNSRKHPLRVPGMKPGESCFICKAKDHIAKSCPEKALWEKNKICLRCRRRGHRATNCPDLLQHGNNDYKYCYNCGGNGHSLANCPQPLEQGGTKFAECFVCKERGHLSKNCPKNAHGIYPKGGCCKICGGVTHLAKDCPDKGKQGAVDANGPFNRSTGIGVRSTGQVTKFVSGDDIEDDFVADDINSGDNNKSTKSKDGDVKPKKGPKVPTICCNMEYHFENERNCPASLELPRFGEEVTRKLKATLHALDH